MGTSIPSAPLATPSAAGLMSAAQVNALAGLQAASVPGSSLMAFSAVIDLTAAPATYQIIPPIAARFSSLLSFWEIKVSTTATVSPTYSVGTNSPSFNNICASQTTAALHTGAVENQSTFPNLATPLPMADLTTSGLVLNITGAGTAAALTARLWFAYVLLPV